MYGLSFSITLGDNPGILTAERAGNPKRTSRICSATSTATLTWASAVDAPRWGVRMISFPNSRKGDSPSGSDS